MDKKYGVHIRQTAPEYSFCAGCDTCMIVCALEHDGLVSPLRSRLFVERDIRTMYHTVHTCLHCTDAPCYEACPKKDKAMCRDGEIVYIVEDECVGCGLCVRACTQTPPRINFNEKLPPEKRRARKCDMCRTRDNGAACAEWCPVRCLEVSE